MKKVEQKIKDTLSILNSGKGFTLLELLVVVLIIGILAAIALPQYKKAVLRSRFATIKNTARVIYEAEQRYYMLHNEYTSKWQNLDINPQYTDFYVSPNNYIVCQLKDRKKNIIMEYIVMLKANQEGKIRCDAYPGDPNSLTNKICQEETGKKTPATSCSNCCVYYYN